MRITELLSHGKDDLEREIIKLNVITLLNHEIILTIYNFKIDEEENIIVNLDSNCVLTEDEWTDIKTEITKLMIETFSSVIEKETTWQ